MYICQVTHAIEIFARLCWNARSRVKSFKITSFWTSLPLRTLQFGFRLLVAPRLNQKMKNEREQSKEKWEAYDTGYSQAVTHPSTNPARQGLTSVIGREPVFSLWYGRRRKIQRKI